MDKGGGGRSGVQTERQHGHIRHHRENSQPAGSRCLTQGAQLGALRQPKGVGWGGVGGQGGRGIYVYLWLTHIAVQQKLTQHCKTITLPKKEKTVKGKPGVQMPGLTRKLCDCRQIACLLGTCLVILK